MTCAPVTVPPRRSIRDGLEPLVLLSLCLGLAGCGEDYDEPSIVRAGMPVVVGVDQTVEREVRGCAFEGARLVADSQEGAVLTVWVSASSDASGTAALSLPFGDYDLEENVQEAHVASGKPTEMQEDHFFNRFDTVTDAISRAHEERCTEWKTIEFTWTNVSGTEPLLVDWEVGLNIEVEQSIEVGIDFRTYD